MQRQLWKRTFKAVGGICSRDSGRKLAILSTITLEMLEVNNNMFTIIVSSNLITTICNIRYYPGVLDIVIAVQPGVSMILYICSFTVSVKYSTVLTVLVVKTYRQSNISERSCIK